MYTVFISFAFLLFISASPATQQPSDISNAAAQQPTALQTFLNESRPYRQQMRNAANPEFHSCTIPQAVIHRIDNQARCAICQENIQPQHQEAPDINNPDNNDNELLDFIVMSNSQDEIDCCPHLFHEHCFSRQIDSQPIGSAPSCPTCQSTRSFRQPFHSYQVVEQENAGALVINQKRLKHQIKRYVRRVLTRIHQELPSPKGSITALFITFLANQINNVLSLFLVKYITTGLITCNIGEWILIFNHAILDDFFAQYLHSRENRILRYTYNYNPAFWKDPLVWKLLGSQILYARTLCNQHTSFSCTTSTLCTEIPLFIGCMSQIASILYEESTHIWNISADFRAATGSSLLKEILYDLSDITKSTIAQKSRNFYTGLFGEENSVRAYLRQSIQTGYQATQTGYQNARAGYQRARDQITNGAVNTAHAVRRQFSNLSGALSRRIFG